MPSTVSDLEELRRRIDEIDDRLLDLLIERLEVVAAVKDRKQSDSTASYQPAREATIIRRLVDSNNGPLPAATLVRMWRELLAATVRLQFPFAVAVFAPPDAQGFWDLTRDHFGSHTPISPYRSTSQVIRAVTESQAAAGVLPMPQEGELDPWWRHLLSKDANAPRVIARLPFGARGNARSDGADALVIGRGVQQETGHDRTFLATENAPGISRGRMLATLSALGFACTFCASYEHAEGANNLIEVEGCVPTSDPRLDRLRAQLGASLHRLLPFGGYAVPLSLAAPAAATAPVRAAVKA